MIVPTVTGNVDPLSEDDKIDIVKFPEGAVFDVNVIKVTVFAELILVQGVKSFPVVGVPVPPNVIEDEPPPPLYPENPELPATVDEYPEKPDLPENPEKPDAPATEELYPLKPDVQTPLNPE